MYLRSDWFIQELRYLKFQVHIKMVKYICKWGCVMFIIDVIGEFKRGNTVQEDCVVSATTDEICTQEPNNPVHEAVERINSEDPRLIERARAVGAQYEFAQDGVVETEPDRFKRHCRNQRKIAGEERRLKEAIGDLPPPPPGLRD